MSKFSRWVDQVGSLPPVAIRTEGDRALAAEQARGKPTSRFARAVRAAQSLQDGYLPDTATLSTMDAETRAALLTLAERLATQGAITAAVLDAARQTLGPPQKKRFRKFIDRVKHLPAHELREQLQIEIANCEALGGKDGNRWFKLKTLQLLLTGSQVDLSGLRAKTRAKFKAIANAQVAQGALPADVLTQLAEADRKTDTMLKNLRKAARTKAKSLTVAQEAEYRDWLKSQALLPSKTSGISKAQRRELKRYLKNRQTAQPK
jgi:hypothetical protein